MLSYSTYLGGSFDAGPDVFLDNAVAVDAEGSVYVTGSTGSTEFPVVAPLQPAIAGGIDAFVVVAELPDTESVSMLVTNNRVTGNDAEGTLGGGGGLLATLSTTRSSGPDIEFNVVGNLIQNNTANESGAGVGVLCTADGDPDSMAAVLRLGAAQARTRGLRRLYGWLPPEVIEPLRDWGLRRQVRRRALPMILPLSAGTDLEPLLAGPSGYIPYQDQF